MFPRYGASRVMFTDGGSHFFGNEFTKCLWKLGIYHTVGTSYHHQTYGQGGPQISNS